MAKHARHSPSKLAALEACACFDSDSSMRKARDLGAADEGTMLHEAVENRDPAILETDEQFSAYTHCLAYAQDIINTIPGRYRDMQEIRSTVRGLTWGTADRVILDYKNRTIHVIDWKFGRVPVTHAEENLQLHCYGAGLFERFRSFTTLTVHLVAPRIPDYTQASFGRDLLPVLRERINNIIEEVGNPFKQPRGGEHCGFCTNKHRCPVMNQAAEGVIRGAGLLELPKEFLAEKIFSPEDRSKSLLLARLLPDWCKLVKQVHTSAVLDYGDEIPGFSLRKRAGTVAIKDPEMVLKFVTETLGFSHEDLLRSGTATMSIAKLAALMMEERPVEELDTKRDYIDALVDGLGDYVARGAEVVFLQKDRKPTDEELVKQLT